MPRWGIASRHVWDMRWVRSVQVQVQPRREVRGRFGDLDLGLLDLVRELVVRQGWCALGECRFVDPLAGEDDVGAAGRAVVVHLAGGVRQRWAVTTLRWHENC